MECLIVGRAQDEYQDVLVEDKIVVVDVQARYDNFGEYRGWRVQKISRLGDYRRQNSRGIMVDLNADKTDVGFCARLRDEVKPYQKAGECPIIIRVKRQSLSVDVRLSKEMRIAPCDEVLERLNCIDGVENVRVVYKSR